MVDALIVRLDKDLAACDAELIRQAGEAAGAAAGASGATGAAGASHSAKHAKKGTWAAARYA